MSTCVTIDRREKIVWNVTLSRHYFYINLTIYENYSKLLFRKVPKIDV